MSRLEIEKIKSFIKGPSFSAEKLTKELSRFASSNTENAAAVGEILRSREKTQREMRGGGSLDQITLLYYLENANKFDVAIFRKAEMIGLSELHAIVLFFIYGTKDLAEFCKLLGITHKDYIEFLGFKQSSALYNINHNF